MNLKTINPERYYDALSYDLSITKNLYRSNLTKNISNQCSNSKDLSDKKKISMLI